jgi:hypothetical protein
MRTLIAQALTIATFVVSPCPGQENDVACTDMQTSTVYTSVWPMPRWIHDHELGHIIDARVLTNADRGTFEYLTHQSRPWEATASDPNSPQEQFAEAFRMCVRSTRQPDGNSIFGFEPSVHTFRRICRWMNTLERPSGKQ